MSINAGTLILGDSVNPDDEIHALNTAETWAEKEKEKFRWHSYSSGSSP